MHLPPALRHAVDAALQGVAAADLAGASERLSQRYRAEVRDGRMHLSDAAAARAYLAARLPATYAAIRQSLAAVNASRPDFAPRTLLDVGAGPGTALWAVADCWPAIHDAVLVEPSAAIRALGETLVAEAGVPTVAWRGEDALALSPAMEPRDLVLLAYVLNEIDPARREQLVRRLWQVTADTLLIVEPGTPAGFERIIAVRETLIRDGAHVLAPCPHAKPCPIGAPDWCHFSRRVARSRLHRQAKSADVPWEDERFVYLAASRQAAAATPNARVIAPPRLASGRATLKLCRPDGSASAVRLSRRDGEAYKAARRVEWGDSVQDPKA